MTPQRPGREPLLPDLEHHLVDGDDGASPDTSRRWRRPTLADLYGAHHVQLLRLAQLLVDDVLSAEDVVQGTYSTCTPARWSPQTDSITA